MRMPLVGLVVGLGFGMVLPTVAQSVYPLLISETYGLVRQRQVDIYCVDAQGMATGMATMSSLPIDTPVAGGALATGVRLVCL